MKQIYIGIRTMNKGGYIKLKISLCFMGRICKSRGTLGCGDDKDSLRGEIGNHLVSFRLLGLLLVEQAPELLELVVEVPAGDHPVVVPSVAEEGIVKGAPHAERREGVDVEGHLFFLGFWFGLVVLSEILAFEFPC